MVNPLYSELLHGLPHHSHLAPVHHRLSGHPFDLPGHPLKSLHLPLHLKGDTPDLLSLLLLILLHPYLFLLGHELYDLELIAEGQPCPPLLPPY